MRKSNLSLSGGKDFRKGTRGTCNTEDMYGCMLERRVLVKYKNLGRHGLVEDDKNNADVGRHVNKCFLCLSFTLLCVMFLCLYLSSLIACLSFKFKLLFALVLDGYLQDTI